MHPDKGSESFPVGPSQGSCQYLLAHVVFMLPPATCSTQPVAHISSTAKQDVLIVSPLTPSPSCSTSPPLTLQEQSMNTLFDVG